DNERVSAGDHADHIAGQRRQRMGDRRDRTDDSERSVFSEGQAMVPREALGLEELDPRNELDDLEFLDLVIEPADFRFFEFRTAEFFSLLFSNLADTFDRLAAVFEPALRKLAEAFGRRLDRLIDRLEDPPRSVARPAGSGDIWPAPKLGEDFLNDLPDGCF